MQRKTAHSLLILATIVLATGGICGGAQNVAITFDENDPRITFAAGEVKKALIDAGYAAGGGGADMRIAFEIYERGIGPQGFRIRREGDKVIRIVGGDSCGAMYGGLELAEMITLGGGLDAVQEKARKPYLVRRGLKFNIPFDARSPSYDDIFIYRWGDADYVREFLQNVPRDLMRWEAGFYMGPDGFVWGREFVSKDPALSGELEIDKHWYRFMLWGRLGYDLTLTRDFFEKRLGHRFAEAKPALLYDTWAAASQIIPQVNQFFFRVNDLQFSPEACVFTQGFLTVDAFFQHPPLQGSGILSVQDYASAVIKDRPFDGITPPAVANNLDKMAKKTLRGVETLRKPPKLSKELAAMLTDMEAMAYLGRYYADKIRGAAALAVFRADSKHKAYHRRAVRHLTNAVEEWQAYARVSTGQYRPQLFSRTNYMDWWKLLEDVKKEVETVRNSKN